MTALRVAAAMAVAGTLFGAVACGGSSSSSSGGNTTPVPVPNNVVITAGAGPSTANPYVNGAFVSVTLCVPGTSQCTTVPDVLLDTGSSGLRVLSSALGGLPLPNMTSGGATIANCIQYVDLSYNWGAVASADVKLAGEVASAIPVQVIADPASTFPSAPSTCTNGGTAANTVDALSANGILGVSSYLYDCGPACAPGTTSNGGLYFACSSGGSCQVTTVPVLSQLRNPVAAFSSDNNGITITLPALPETGLPSTTGTLTFGIGTQTDNALGSAIVQTQNGSGNFTTVFRNASYSSSFIDSGSNALYFLDSKTTGLPACQSSSGLYCPSTTQSLMATNTGANGKANVVNFAVANADKLPAPNWVFDDIAGSSSVGGSQSGLPSLYFDWGLPFFFGRTVFVAIEGRSTPGGTGPYWAY